MTDIRERANSTHEAYLKRVSIPPIMIPQPQEQQLTPQTPHVSHVKHLPQTPHISHTPHASHAHRIIPRLEKRPTRLPPLENNLPTGAKGCICGCGKITAGYLMCPFICPLSCLAGTCRGIYHAATCDKYNDGTDPHKLCTWFGCYNACVISSTLIEEGVADMRRKPQGEQDMSR
jgi:hypothetical protein